MTNDIKTGIDLTVRSFAHVAKQLARSSGIPYEKILREADKHRSALLLVQRDVIESAKQALLRQSITRAEFDRARTAVEQAIAQAQQTITGIAARYAPQRLAA